MKVVTLKDIPNLPAGGAAERIRRWTGGGLDVYVYFDNDAKVHAPWDALRLAERLGVGPGVETKVIDS